MAAKKTKKPMKKKPVRKAAKPKKTAKKTPAKKPSPKPKPKPKQRIKTGQLALLRSVQKRVDSISKMTLGFGRKLRAIEFSLEREVSGYKKSTESRLKELESDIDDKLSNQNHELNKQILKLRGEIERQIVESETKLSHNIRHFEDYVEDVSRRLQTDIDLRERLEDLSPRLPQRIGELERQIETSQHLMTDVVDIMNKFRSNFDMRKVDARISDIEQKIDDLDMKDIKKLLNKMEAIQGDLKKAFSKSK